MVKSPKTGAYIFDEQMVPNEAVKDFFKNYYVNKIEYIYERCLRLTGRGHFFNYSAIVQTILQPNLKQKTMQSDPKQCLYCTNNQTLHDLMIEICPLQVSRAFLFKEQTYRGRCLVAYNGHVNDLNELSDDERNKFMADVAHVTRAMQKAFNPEKINYGAYSDKLSHLHFHLAPKYVDGPDYGGTFQMNPGKVYLSDAEYQEMIEKIKSFL